MISMYRRMAAKGYHQPSKNVAERRKKLFEGKQK